MKRNSMERSASSSVSKLAESVKLTKLQPESDNGYDESEVYEEELSSVELSMTREIDYLDFDWHEMGEIESFLERVMMYARQATLTKSDKQAMGESAELMFEKVQVMRNENECKSLMLKRILREKSH